MIRLLFSSITFIWYTWFIDKAVIIHTPFDWFMALLVVLYLGKELFSDLSAILAEYNL